MRNSIQLSKTVGTYSEGNLFVVYEIKRQVLVVSSCLYYLTGGNVLSDSSVTDDNAFDSLHGGL